VEVIAVGAFAGDSFETVLFRRNFVEDAVGLCDAREREAQPADADVVVDDDPIPPLDARQQPSA
jgi:hypothetical protein